MVVVEVTVVLTWYIFRYMRCFSVIIYDCGDGDDDEVLTATVGRPTGPRVVCCAKRLMPYVVLLLVMMMRCGGVW